MLIKKEEGQGRGGERRAGQRRAGEGFTGHGRGGEGRGGKMTFLRKLIPVVTIFETSKTRISLLSVRFLAMRSVLFLFQYFIGSGS